MKDLRFYDFDFNLLAIEHKIISSDWKVYHRGAGKAEIHISKSAKCLETLFENKYLLMTQGEFQGIITAKQIGADCVIYAKTPEWLLSKKVIKSFEEVTENAEAFVRGKVAEAFSDCENFVLGDLCEVTDEVTLSEDSYCVLSKATEDVLEKCGAGYKLSFDVQKKQWIFSVTKGVNRSILIAEDLLNASKTEYISDIQNYASTGFYERMLSDEEREEEKFEGEKTVWEELIKDEKSGILRWEKLLSSSAESDAIRELDDAKCYEEITAKIRNLSLHKDYELGDIVTLSMNMPSLKRTKKYVITGVEIWEESGNKGEKPIFEEWEW